MKKKLIGFFVLCGIAALIAWKQSSAAPRLSMAEKMQRKMEEMPDDFPPVVMFKNVAATRENTDRILELLEERVETGKSKSSSAA